MAVAGNAVLTVTRSAHGHWLAIVESPGQDAPRATGRTRLDAQRRTERQASLLRAGRAAHEAASTAPRREQ
jgi:hypothetical protein